MIVDCAVFSDGVRTDGPATLEAAVERVRTGGAFAWIALHEPSADELDVVAKELGLHPLAVEDAVESHQRPKLEVYDGTLFVVVRAARYDDVLERVVFHEVMAFVGEGFVVTVRHGPITGVEEVRERLAEDPELLTEGPSAVLYALLDHVVDDYAPVMIGLELDIDEVEEQVFSPDAPSVAERIYKLKREVLEFYRSAAAMVEPVDRLARRAVPRVPATMHHHYRDVHDHLVRITGQLAGFRELLTSVLEANLAQVGVRQNEDMRKISAWVAIVAAPTLIAGIYGMNFQYMPELEWRYGYPMTLVVIAAVCLGLYRAFKRAGWL